MAAPQVQDIHIKVKNQILLTFDQALDTQVQVPLTCFSVNYGRVPITSWKYESTAEISLQLGQNLGVKDKIEVNYQPPEDIDKALTAPQPADANILVKRRNVVRAFFKVPALNQLSQNEAVWNENSNLGVNDDGDVAPGNPNGDPWEAGCSSLDGKKNNSAAAGYKAYPISTRPNPRTATPDDFILAYGLKEAIQLSNLDDADAIQPNTDKIWMAIQDASALIDNYIVQASRGGQLLISSNRRRTALIIARYYLDSVRRREDVKDDYERCLTEIERAMSMESVVRPDPPWWQDPCNNRRACGVRSHRIPQFYNSVSGKGLSGWWTDSGYISRNDWRYMRLNSEGNNNEPNRHGVNPSVEDSPLYPTQPADDGGTNYPYTGGSSG